MHLTTLTEIRERGDFITVFKLMNNMEETDRKKSNIEKKRRIENAKKGICLNDTKSTVFPKEV